MAAVTKGNLRPVSPPGYEVNDKGQAKVAIAKGDLLLITADTPLAGHERVYDKAVGGTIEAHAIALMDCPINGTVNAGIQGEMDGYSGLVPGAPLYPSASVAGGLDTTATATPITRVRAVTTTRIRYSFV